MAFPMPPWATSDRGVLAPIPLRASWSCPTVLCNPLPWTSSSWLFPTSAWAMELLQSSPTAALPSFPGPMMAPAPTPTASIFPPPFLYRPPFPCQCCPPPTIKPFMVPTNFGSAYDRSIGCTVSGSPNTTDPKPSPQLDREYRCTHCFKSYTTAAAFHMHLRTHVQGCQCPICGKSFSRHWLLQGHIRTHTGEKPFSCPRCGKAFADKSNLRAHVQTHSGLKPFTCGRCGKAFALKSYLSKHEESACVKSVE